MINNLLFICFSLIFLSSIVEYLVYFTIDFLKNLYIKCYDIFLNWHEILRRIFIQLLFNQSIIMVFCYLNIMIIKLVLSQKILILCFLGAFFENSPSLFTIGLLCKNWIMLLKFLIICSILSAIGDFIIFVVLKFFSSELHLNSTENYENFLHNSHPIIKKINIFLQKYIFLLILTYRFIPLSRFPIFLLLQNSVSIQYFIIPNILGAILWIGFFLIFGYIV